MRWTERLLTQIHYEVEEEVSEAEDSGYEFPRATTDQLQNTLDALTRHEFGGDDLTMLRKLLYTMIVPISGRGGEGSQNV